MVRAIRCIAMVKHTRANTLKGVVRAMAFEPLLMENVTKGNGSRTNNTATALVISPTTINTWVFGFVGINKVMA